MVSSDHDTLHDIIDFNTLSRREKRSLVFHILYAAEAHDYDLSTHAVVDNLSRGFFIDIPFDSDVVKMAESIIEKRSDLDQQYLPFLSNWRPDRIGISTKLILRFALWELLYTDMLGVIIMNEAIELAKCFAEKDAYKFVNGLLDEMIKTMPDRVERPYESDKELQEPTEQEDLA